MISRTDRSYGGLHRACSTPIALGTMSGKDMAESTRMDEKMDGNISVSIVIPVFNAELTITALAERLVGVFKERYSLQIVLVNDGSHDQTHDVCMALVKQLPGIISYIRLAKNFGEHNAVMAGLRHAVGEYVVIMDDDFQNRPEDAIRLVEDISTRNLDIVYSFSRRREQSWLRILGSCFHGMIANVMLDKPKDLYLASFKCLRRWLVKEIVKYKGPFPYVDGLALRCTRSIGCIEVAHQRRAAGRSGYNLRKLMRLWLHMLINFSVMPLRLSSFLGLVLVACAVVLSIGVMVEKLLAHDVPTGWPFLAIITMLFSGAQLLMLGVIGEYVGHLFLAMNETPQFVIRECRGFRMEHGHDGRD
jgi:glycosyltransferase involved in cell wall biosynthesis